MSGGIDIVSWSSGCAGGRSDGVSCQQLHDVGRSERRRSYGMGALLTPDFEITTRDITYKARDEYKGLCQSVSRSNLACSHIFANHPSHLSRQTSSQAIVDPRAAPLSSQSGPWGNHQSDLYRYMVSALGHHYSRTHKTVSDLGVACTRVRASKQTSKKHNGTTNFFFFSVSRHSRSGEWLKTRTGQEQDKAPPSETVELD